MYLLDLSCVTVGGVVAADAKCSEVGCVLLSTSKARPISTRTMTIAVEIPWKSDKYDIKSTIESKTPYVELNDKTTNYGVCIYVKLVHQGLHKLRQKCYHARFYHNRYDRDYVKPRCVGGSKSDAALSSESVYGEDFVYDETGGNGIFSQW